MYLLNLNNIYNVFNRILITKLNYRTLPSYIINRYGVNNWRGSELAFWIFNPENMKKD